MCQPHFGNRRGNDDRKTLMRYVVVLKYGQIQVRFNYNQFSNRMNLMGWIAHTHTTQKNVLKPKVPGPVYVTLFGNWVLIDHRCNQVRIRKSGWTLVGLVSLWEEGSLDMDTWRMPHAGQRSEWCSCKPRIAGQQKKPGGCMEQFSPTEFRGGTAPTDIWFPMFS